MEALEGKTVFTWALLTLSEQDLYSHCHFTSRDKNHTRWRKREWGAWKGTSRKWMRFTSHVTSLSAWYQVNLLWLDESMGSFVWVFQVLQLCLKSRVPVDVHVCAEDNKESANSGLLGVLETQKWWHPPVCQGAPDMDTHIYMVWTLWGWRGWGRHEGSGEQWLHPVRIWWPRAEKQRHKTRSNVHEQTLLEEQRNLCLGSGPYNKSLIHNACLSRVPELGLLT